ncbi:hypothetical protein ACSVDA_11910 [Cytobacillus sp. Hm23]
MYFEGKCLAKDLIPTIADHITNATDESGEPLWLMVSSNIGVRDSLNNNDGWVFKSSVSNSCIGFKNGFYDKDNDLDDHLKGYYCFTADSYTPSETPGQDGTFNIEKNESMPLLDQWFNNYNPNNLPMRYYMSITKERVIIAYYSDVNVLHSRTNLVYLGKPAWSSDPGEEGFVMGTGIAHSYNYNGRVYQTGFHMQKSGTQHMIIKSILSNNPKGWGGAVYPSKLFLTHWGIRGVLDLLVCKQDGSFRKIDNITIDDIEYLAVELPSSSTIDGSNRLNNFCPEDFKQTNMYLFPKI